MASVVQTFATALLLHIACAKPIPPFESFIEKHARTYQQGSSEFKLRRELYEQRRVEAELHNNRSDRLWTAGVNKLWDWTNAELQSLRGWDGSARPAHSSARSIRRHLNFLQREDLEQDLPTEKIWSNLAMAKRVKNQGDCGSCWAIATATVLEGHSEIYTGKARSFSVQQIVECTPNPRHCGGDGGCQGATAELAMDWVLKNGCAEEIEVPYTAEDHACPTKSAKMAQVFSAGKGASSLGMTGWETLPKNEYEPLAKALAFKGPVAVSVAANTWLNYDSGIFNNCDKDAVIDHAVVAIGYGEENGNKFWVIQNSWGDDWGEGGHIRLQRHDSDSYCGMNNDPQKGVACQGETDPVPVCGMCGVLFDSVIPHFGQ